MALRYYKNTDSGAYNCAGYALHRYEFLTFRHYDLYSDIHTVLNTLKKHFGFDVSRSQRPEQGKQKIAIYGYQTVLHFARIIGDDVCMSKCGPFGLVKHRLHDAPYSYGNLIAVVERPKQGIKIIRE